MTIEHLTGAYTNIGCNMGKRDKRQIKYERNLLKISLTLGPLLLILTIVSCNQGRIEQINGQRVLNDNKESYYYRNQHCFDFVKRCELEILRLEKHDTLVYVSSSQFHGQYEEIHGKLTKINDSIFHVKPFKYLAQNGNDAKPLNVSKDTIYFYCDSSLINSTVKIEYLNGQSNQHQIYSTTNKFKINETYFNRNNDRLYLSFDFKNPIVNEFVEIVSKYNDPKYSVVFTSVEKLPDFYIIVTDNNIKTLNIGTGSHQNLGPRFELEKMAKATQLPKGRQLYD